MTDALQNKVATFAADVALAHQLVHGQAAEQVATEGGNLPTFAALQEGLAAAAAITETGQNRQAAEAAKVAAEAARDVAASAAGVYPDTASGLAATAVGDYFSVPSPEEDEVLILYRNNAGAAVEIKRYPSAAWVASARESMTAMAASLVLTQSIIATHHAFV